MKRFAALVAVLALVAFAAPAFAANPFMDVPMNHWAYDAVSQLASRGVVSGYPDGAFKGEWKATRYEMASVVARALAYVDMNKASKQDLELLKKLVVEFKDELDALGVKVDELDARVAVLEKDIGGWRIWGEFRFDAKFSDGNKFVYNSVGGGSGTSWEHVTPISTNIWTKGEKDFEISRYRIWLSKRIDDKVTFIARLGGADVAFERYYLDVKLPWDANLLVGKWLFDWEGDDNLYNDNDAIFTDRAVQGFYLKKTFGMGDFHLFASQGDWTYNTGYSTDWDWFYDGTGNPGNVANWDYRRTGWNTDTGGGEAMLYGARVNVAFNENFGGSLNFLYLDGEGGWDQKVWWVAPYVNFTPGIALRGAYFDSDGDQGDGNMWKAILDIDQSVLGFTSIWLEYVDVDRDFFGWTASNLQYGVGRGLAQYDDFGGPMTPGLGEGFADGTAWFVRLDQKWNEKWATFVRYGKTSLGVPNPAFYGFTPADDYDTVFWTFGIKYWYTPALSFELSYSDVDYGAGWEKFGTQDDSMIRLRTYVSF
ncbi:MAG: S-layer homology domain-containing protein [Synergistales bacterium]|nr:S-layer homology domain-containing protein [Synergistales bacterium]HQL01789.1 S-layer homology domain-containing protein [Synergistales bacterium]